MNKYSSHTTTVSARVNEEIALELDEIASALVSTRSNVLAECIKYGIAAFKKERPEIENVINAVRERKQQQLATPLPSPAVDGK